MIYINKNWKIYSAKNMYYKIKTCHANIINLVSMKKFYSQEQGKFKTIKIFNWN